MSVVALITAFVGKKDAAPYLTVINGKPVVQHCYETAVDSHLFTEVIVLTDNDDVVAAIEHAGGVAVKQSRCPESSVDAVAEHTLNMETAIVVHIQGNIPFLNEAPVGKLLKTFDDATSKNIQAASIVYKLQNAEEIESSERIKVALDMRLFAMYFSRYPIPYLYHKDLPISHYAYTGIFIYRKSVLLNFMNWPVAPLERTEQIESLRFLENGISIKMLISQQPITQVHSSTVTSK